MTSINITGNIAYMTYVPPDWMRAGAILFTLIVFIISFDFYTDLTLAGKLGLFIMPIAAIYQLTYRTGTVIYKTRGIALHTLTIFGYKITNELNLSEVHLSARLNSSRYFRYPVLRLVTDNNKKYVIGAFIRQDINSFVDELQQFYKIKYEEHF